MRLTFAALIISLGLGCTTQVQHGLDEREANEIQTVLAERGLKAEKVAEPGKKPTWSIELPTDQSADGVRVLAELGLPRPKAQGISDVFGKGSLVPSPTEERALYLEAISGELSRTLEAVDGVVCARVHMVLPPPARSGGPATPSKAAAFLKVRPGSADRLNQMRDELKALVAGAVENLAPDQVTLVITEVSTTVPLRPPEAATSPRLRLAATGLGATVTLLSLVVVWLALRLRRGEHATSTSPRKTPTAPLVPRRQGA